jgi:Acyl-CoA reductase (LuxC)
MKAPAENSDLSPLQNVQILAAVDATGLNGHEIASLRNCACLPFTKARCEQLGHLSQRIMRHPFLRQDPGSVAVAFWLRPANLVRIIEAYRRSIAVELELVPAGFVFHIAPANVDTMFLYSWALAYIAGNASVVRLSTERSRTIAGLLECIEACMHAAPTEWVGNAFVTYAHDDRITAVFSALCDHRVVWGGDETVGRIRQVPLSPHASERSFASKFSFSVMPSDRFLELDPKLRLDLVHRLLTDLTPFAQQACSSPHVLYWLGPEQAGRDAISAWSKTIDGMPPTPSLAQNVERVAAVFGSAADGGDWLRDSLYPDLWNLKTTTDGAFHHGFGYGVLTHGIVQEIRQLAHFCTPADQTIGYWGLSKEQLRTLAQDCGMAGVDRVVPLGKALEFAPIWDGFDLLGDFVRKVWIGQ